MNAFERLRQIVATLFYAVWTLIGVALIGLAVLWVADGPDDPLWTVDPPAPNN